jgi:parvulin-like peptidyl-prolyl isomerase
MPFFNRRKREKKEKVRCAHILLRTEKEANAVLEQLKKGEKFSKIAKKVSTCPSRKRGGDLGSFGRGEMVKEFEDVAFTLKKGETSPVVKTQFGYHIIKRL